MHKVIDFAAIQFPGQEVVSRTVEGPMHASNYRARSPAGAQGRQTARARRNQLGDRVATLAWNGYRHLEAGTASPASARSITPSIRASSPIRSPGS